ncbi:MAG: F-box-like domain-containing protein [Chlamydiia bacterium]|nr:F-box-like domain-containing protein [Chlamydiia bacterium]
MFTPEIYRPHHLTSKISVPKKENFFSTLPDEIMVYIFSYLSLRNLITVQFVCRRWKAISNASCLWKNFASQAGVITVQDRETWRENVIKCQTFLLCKEGLTPMRKTIYSPWGGISCSALDKKQLVMGIYDRKKTLQVTDLNSFPIRSTILNGERNQTTTALFRSPLIWTGDSSGKISIWNTIEKQHKRTSFSAHKWRISALAQKEQYLLSSSHDTTICLWDIETNLRLFSHQVHQKEVNSAIFVGPFYISGSSDHTIRLFNIKSKEMLVNINAGHPVQCLSSFDTAFISLCNQKIVNHWDTRQTKAPLRIIDTTTFLSVSSIAMHGYAYLIAGINLEKQSVIQIRSIVSDKIALTLSTQEEGPAQKFHIEGDTLISEHKNAIISWKFSEFKLKIWKKAPSSVFNDTINRWI